MCHLPAPTSTSPNPWDSAEEPLDIPRTRDHTETAQHDTQRVICTSLQDRGRWLSSGDGVATLLARLRKIPRGGTTGLDEGQSRPVCISPFGSNMTLFRPTSPCLCHALPCLPAILRSPAAPCAGPQTKRDGPGWPQGAWYSLAVVLLRKEAAQPAAQRRWGMGQLSASSEYEARKKQPKIPHRSARILPRYEVLTGALALFGTIQPH